jgi:hypothetical protein
MSGSKRGQEERKSVAPKKAKTMFERAASFTDDDGQGTICVCIKPITSGGLALGLSGSVMVLPV